MELMNTVLYGMMDKLDQDQLCELKKQLQMTLYNYNISKIETTELSVGSSENTKELLEYFAVCKLGSGRNHKTIKQYLLVAHQLCECTNKELAMITSDDVIYFLAKYPYTKKPNVSQCTMDTKRRYLSSIFGLLKKHKKIAENPMDMVEQIKYTSRLKIPFTDKELEDINIAVSSTKNKTARIRNSAIMQLCLDTGARVSELTNINIADIDFSKKEVKLLGKGNKERLVYFSDKSKNKLNDYLKLRNKYDDNSPLFMDIQHKHRLKTSGVRSMMKRLSVISGVKNIHPHRLRAQCSCNLAKAGIQIDLIAKYLGHVNLDVVQRYVVNTSERLRQTLHEVGIG